MFNDYVKLQRFPLAILIFSPLFSLKTVVTHIRNKLKYPFSSPLLTLPLPILFDFIPPRIIDW